ncbi:MAG: alpha/beta hydrolase [Acidobacteriota bacterium]
MSLRAFSFGLFLCSALPALAGDQLPTVDPTFQIEFTQGLVYGVGEVEAPAPGQKDLLLDLYEPIGAGQDGELLPALVIIHGGGFVGGSRQQSQLVDIALEAASRGYVAISIDYRLEPDAPVTSARVEPILQGFLAGQGDVSTAQAEAIVAAIDDGLTALDWLLASAPELGVDPDRIGLLGGSAGAITSVHLAYILDNYGLEPQAVRFVIDLWGGSVIPPDDAEAAAAHLGTGEAPLFAIHGELDSTVPVELSDLLTARALDQQVPYEYHPIADAGHGFGSVDLFNREVTPGVTLFDRALAFARSALQGTVPLVPPVFTDGFESGDTSAWGETVSDP